MRKFLWRTLLLNVAALAFYWVGAGEAIASATEIRPVSQNPDSQNSEQQAAVTSVEALESFVEFENIDRSALSPSGLEIAQTEVSNTTRIEPTEIFSAEPSPAESSMENGDRISPIAEIESPPSITQTASLPDSQGAMSQLSSVSQLSDVQPTDWAFQAVQSLVERYGCIAGYPDGTYRGNRSLTRYEFAAGLNACLDRVNELIAEGLADAVSREDLATIERLQQEFAAELASLHGRVDTLEARTAELEANQFSTTTTLSGLVWFNLTGAFADGDIQVETSDITAPPVIRPAGRDPVTGRPLTAEVTDDPEITFSNLAWITLNTSFTGRDNLVTQLAVGNGDSPANVFASAGLYNTFGVPYTDQTGGVDIGDVTVVVRELFYEFPVGDDVQVIVGPRVNWYRYFDNNSFTFFLNGTSSFNSIGSTLLNTIDRGSGAVALWQLSDQFRLGVGYLGENNEFLPASLFRTSSNPDEGLFGGTNTLTAEVTYSPTSTFNIRLLYNRSNLNAVFGQVGGAPGEPIYGLLDDGAGGGLNDATADTFNINFDWLITPGIGIFSRYTYGITHIEPGDVDAQAFQAGLAFPDLGKEGALATLSYMIPFSVLDGREFLVSGGGDGGVQYEFEATYYYPLTDNIALVPAFYIIGNANNFSDNPTIYVGNLRAQFAF
ncbi:iron uptake porin [Leptolyngbya sp. FACHB-541]|uniref:iron uptake porin n=1 Tax=Leptolyngbya sp. FACHB-541 TaxID=2692810 RepID=UPI001F556877|nr:iron uptake porin [Leptolyngbya sp. FACHB-541]